MVDAVWPERPRQFLGHVMLDEVEAAIALQMRQIVRATRLEIIDAEDPPTVTDQPIDEIGSNESGSAGNERYRLNTLQRHNSLSPEGAKRLPASIVPEVRRG